MTKDDKTFEENLLELENIVKELEAGNVDLDKAIEKTRETGSTSWMDDYAGNEFSADELENIPGIGAVKAESIVSYREENGDFKDIG